MNNREDQSFDYSYYKSRLPRKARRQMRDVQPEPKAMPPRVRRVGPDPIPAHEIKAEIKKLLLREPGLQVEQIFKRLNFAVTVSKTTVSGIRSEFRHSLQVITDAGLLK